MGFLIFLDEMRAGLVWIMWAAVFGLAVYLFWASKNVQALGKTVMRVAGTLLVILFICASCMLGVGVLMGADPPREHTVFISATGQRVALLSHSSLRDSAATQVSVNHGCCRRWIAYEYFGDDDDYMDANSVQWTDDHHLTIRFAVDPTGQQTCRPSVGDVIVSCEPHPDPTLQHNH